MGKKVELSGADRFVQVAAIGAGVVGVAVIAAFGVLLWAGGDRPSANFDSERSAQIGDFIGGVAGPLFALAAGLLFYLTLTLQRKEFQNSLHELRVSSRALKKSASNHQETLTVMRQEKEFNVCLSAVQNTISELERFEFVGSVGSKAISRAVSIWWGHTQTTLSGGMASTDYLFKEVRGLEDVFYRFNELEALNVHLYWTLNAINGKELAEDDRRYLLSLISPVQQSVEKSQEDFPQLQKALAEALQWNDFLIEERNLDREMLKKCQEQIMKLIKMKEA